MEPLRVAPDMWDNLHSELLSWHQYGAKSCIQSAVDDYAALLARNRTLEERILRLESDNSKLKKEKQDLVDENARAKQQAHLEIVASEGRMKQKIKGLEVDKTRLTDELAKVTTIHVEASNERDGLQQEKRHLETRVAELEQAKSTLEVGLEDTEEALRGEHDARTAAVSELEARLAAKERAEVEKETAERKFRELEKRFFDKEDWLAKAQEDANAEFHKYKAMQQQFEAEKVLWEEQHSGRQTSVQPRPGFTIGSVFGSVRNAILPPSQAPARQASTGETGSPPELLALVDEVQQEVIPARHPESVFKQHKRSHGGGCNSVAFAPSGMYAATCGQDGVIRLWTPHDGLLSTHFSVGGGADGMNCVAFAEEKGALLGACNDKSIQVWDMHTARIKFAMTGHTKAVTSVALHPTSLNIAASCSDDRLVKIWSVNDGICRRSILCRSKPLSVTFSRDGNFVVTGHYDGSLHVFETSTGSEAQAVAHVHMRECVAVVPTAMSLKMLSVGRDSVVCLSDVYKAKTLKRYQHQDILHVGQARCTPAVAPDDSVVAVGSASGLLLLLDMETGQVVSKLSHHSSAITAVAWNSQNAANDVVTMSVDKAGDVVFWKPGKK